METIVSAIMSDLLSRALSMVIRRYKRSTEEEAEHKLQRLGRVLLRIAAMVEEAEGRHITNQAMLRQLEMLRQGMYEGHYMLDTVKCRGQEGDGEVSGDLPVTLPRFSSARPRLRLPSFPIISSKKNLQNTMLNTESLNKLDKMLDGLETLMGDTVEFAVFLEGYPRIPRQPYSTHLILDKVMFGRQTEKETIINFLLRRGVAAGDEGPKVLPIVGAAWVGKTTLIEHVCLDERVREHFSSIVFFTEDDLGAKSMACLRDIGVIKHQDLTATSYGRSLAVIELAGDMDEETWRRLYSSAARSMAHGSKIIVTSRSEKIAALGTTQQALRLRYLPRDAYWYFFRTLAFGSANPEDQPKLASLAMEIAVLLNGTLGANIIASLMRANLNARFWSRLLQCLRDYTSRHVLMFGEHPEGLMQKGKPVYACRMTQQSQNSILVGTTYQKCSTQSDASMLTVQDIITGCVTDQAKFTAVLWRSRIPPYYTYLVNCESQKAGCSTVGKKRPRQARF
ncbi:hypothetical protein GQ55_5G177400 [Panicum hallii var. hallii]|uniref:Disease resistance N-terminal domain-containing protein n=1 Tax=Panicum hallii var. hallii TaxID=1504633 RepID=A0A2T7DHE7_9POAL|nr:hypothetical protein GQ55_5G177400 [Panicum hallii var. hallii]